MMKSIQRLLAQNKKLRVIGIDDAPLDPGQDVNVSFAGVICIDTRFDGMIWGSIKKDANDATRIISRLIKTSKFYDQINAILFDGIAVAGFNIIDLKQMAAYLARPCVAVMRRLPDMPAIRRALAYFTDAEERLALIRNAGKVHHYTPFYFQVQGIDPHTAFRMLAQVTDQGYVPEALRLAHMIGAAVKTGQSGNRA